MRADKVTNIANVAKELINDPLATQRELAERANVGLGTANRVKQEMEQNGTKDDRIIGITDTDLSILTIGQREIERRLNDKEEIEKIESLTNKLWKSNQI